MTQENKELLLKDLCARLPYKVKVQDIYYNSLEPAPVWLIDINAQNVRMFADEGYQSIEHIRPYLFPLSSMTKEQKEEYHNLCSVGTDECGDIIYFNTYESIDYLNKNKFDYRYLIPMGLAIDATGLNIY
jgi:hypothetical protein